MLNNPKSGFGQAAEFQVSALPWVTSSIAPASSSFAPAVFNFPKVTRFITVSNRDTGSSTLSFGFTRAGVTGSYKYILNPNQTITTELRVTSMFVQGEIGTPAFSIIAGLTLVDSSEMPVLTGSVGGVPGWDNVG